MTIKNEKQELRDAIYEEIQIPKSPAVKSGVEAGIFDASTGLFIERELNFLQARAYEVKTPAYKAMDVFPKDAEISVVGKSNYTYKINELIGEASIGELSGDIAIADVSGTPAQGFVTNVKQAFEYNVEELKAAQDLGTDLSEWKMRAAVKSINRTINRLSWTGDEDRGFVGFLNNTAIPVGTMNSWTTLTGSELAKAIVGQLAEVFNEFQEDATAMYLDPTSYKLLDDPFSDLGDLSVKSWLLRNTSLEKIDFVPELAGAGVGGLDRMILMNETEERRPTMVFEPVEFLETQRKDLGLRVPGYAKFGGIKVVYPTAHRFVDISA